jgi:hypothetical protein
MRGPWGGCARGKGRLVIGQIRPAPSARARVYASVVAVVLALLVSAAFASSAHAIEGHFCPSFPGGEVSLSAYGSSENRDRCAGPFHSSFISVEARNTATPVLKCAVLKPNSNGSGGNVGGLSAACAEGTSIATQFPGGLGGYGTIINLSGNFHSGFEGRHSFS